MNFKIFRIVILFGGLLLLTSCLHLFQKDMDPKVQGLPEKTLSLFFSQNIFGELESCGCPLRPLGGVHNFAAIVEKFRKKGPSLYLDLGNTFFPKEIILPSEKEFVWMKAQYLAQALKALSLKFQIPGPLDLSFGIEKFLKLNALSGSQILISNFQSSQNFPTKVLPSFTLDYGPHNFQFLGILSPELFPNSFRKYLKDPTSSLEEYFKKDSLKDGPFSRTVLLFYGSKELRNKLAKKFPHITWIIGLNGNQIDSPKKTKTGSSHSLSLEKENHFLGVIQFDLTSSKKRDLSQFIEVEEGPHQGPLFQSLQKIVNSHKEQLRSKESERRKKEAALWEAQGPTELKTFHQCKECHTPQTEFWKKTGHALAFTTLQRVKMDQVSKCQRCHSLRGVWEKESSGAFAPLQPAPSESYWKDLGKVFSPPKVIRDLDSGARKILVDKWEKLDSRYKVEKNHLNVQCLNCHQMGKDHPFVVQQELSLNQIKTLALKKRKAMKKKCLACHDKSNTPAWYPLPKDLTSRKFNQAFKQVSCPKNE